MHRINDDNFEEYAVNNYRNPNCISVLEFLDDLKKIKYIKRLINKYQEKDDLKDRLILNHIIFLSNVFGVEATVEMLRFKMGDDLSILNAFFVYLNYVNDDCVYDVNLLEKIKKTI